MSRQELRVVRFTRNEFDLEQLAKWLTALKARASRTPTPVTAEQLDAIHDGDSTSVLLLQIAPDNSVVGMCHLAVIYLEDRVHLGPICVQEGVGHGTALRDAAIEYVRERYRDIRRIDATNRPDHDLVGWYKKAGFQVINTRVLRLDL